MTHTGGGSLTQPGEANQGTSLEKSLENRGNDELGRGRARIRAGELHLLLLKSVVHRSAESVSPGAY